MNKILELSQKGRTLRRRVAKLAEPEGEWKTINGRHVLVGKGESPLEALNKSLGGREDDVSGGGELSTTLSGWRVNHKLKDGTPVEYGKSKPVTRGQFAYWFLRVGDKERRFKYSGPGTGESKLKTVVEKLGLSYKSPPTKSLLERTKDQA